MALKTITYSDGKSRQTPLTMRVFSDVTNEIVDLYTSYNVGLKQSFFVNPDGDVYNAKCNQFIIFSLST